MMNLDLFLTKWWH